MTFVTSCRQSKTTLAVRALTTRRASGLRAACSQSTLPSPRFNSSASSTSTPTTSTAREPAETVKQAACPSRTEVTDSQQGGREIVSDRGSLGNGAAASRLRTSQPSGDTTTIARRPIGRRERAMAVRLAGSTS